MEYHHMMRNFRRKMLLPRKKLFVHPWISLNRPITMTAFKLKWPITFPCYTWLTMRFPCMSKFPIFMSFPIIHFFHNLHKKIPWFVLGHAFWTCHQKWWFFFAFFQMVSRSIQDIFAEQEEIVMLLVSFCSLRIALVGLQRRSSYQVQ